jgi:hypothetical protein
MACTVPSFASIEEILVSTFHFADQSHRVLPPTCEMVKEVRNSIHRGNLSQGMMVISNLLIGFSYAQQKDFRK